MVANLPTLDEAFDRLCATGDQFPDAEAYITNLEQLTYEHPTRGVQPIRIDSRALAATQFVYTNTWDMLWALRGYDVQATEMIHATNLIEQLFLDESKLIWGVSGYSSAFPGVNYDREGQGIKTLYHTFTSTELRPSLVIDGGVREGCLGLNGVVAAMYDVPTLGCIPLRGLANVGIRTHMIIHGKTYRDRQELVGTLPDVLVCVGGGGLNEDGSKGGTLEECLFALQNGCAVLLLVLRDDYPSTSLPSSYHDIQPLVDAEASGQLIVCRSREDIPRYVEQIVNTSHAWVRQSRNYRIPFLARMLGPWD